VSRSIVLGDGFELPETYVTATGALLAVRGAGKTNGARVMAEGMFDAGLPFVAIDPVGSWFGLRSGRDGKPAGGIAIPIFGGRHGDVPIDRAEGADVADIIVRENLSCLIDLSRFESEAAKKDFLLAFAKRLYEENTSARHLFLEEADDYIPQRPMREEVKLLRAWENIVRRGRGRGLGMTMLTQRSASINKNVLTQVETLFVMRTSGPQDRKAIEGWVRSSSVEVPAKDLATVPQLKSGEAFCWSPHFLGKVERFRFRLSRTWDSGATPEAGKQRAATLAQVNVEKLAEELNKPSPEHQREAEADTEYLRLGGEVEELRDRLAGAEGERDTLRERLAQTEARLRVEDGQIARLEKAAREIELAGLSVVEAARDLFIRLPAHDGSLDSVPDLSPALGTQARKPASSNGKAAPTFPQGHTVQVPERGTLVAQGRRMAIKKGDRIELDDAGEVQVTRTHKVREEGEPAVEERCRRLLATLATHGPCTVAKLALLAGYAQSGGSFKNGIGRCRSEGWVLPGPMPAITSEGRAALGEYEPLPSGRRLREWWYAKLEGRQKRVLEAALEALPKELTPAQLAYAAGYEPTGGSFKNAIGALRTMGLLSKGPVVKPAKELR
jgi:hypothetical protein